MEGNGSDEDLIRRLEIAAGEELAKDIMGSRSKVGPDDSLRTFNVERLNDRDKLTEDFLEQSFNDPKFIDYIKSMILHADRNLAESGFVVREEDGKPKISELVKAPKMKSDLNASFTLIRSREGDKANVFIDLHSHPFDRRQDANWEDAIVPSPKDLDSFITDSVIKRGIIGGIVTPDGEDAKLLLYQLDPTKELNTFYQTFEKGESLAKFRRLLDESGIRNAVVTLPKQDRSFSPAEMVKIKQFAVAPRLAA